MSQSPEINNEVYEAASALHDHVFDMFDAQNAIIDMEMRHDITDLSVTGTESEKELISLYASSIETFVAYVAENPDKVTRALQILKGEDPSSPMIRQNPSEGATMDEILKLPRIDFDWVQEDERTFTCVPVPGWPLRIRQALGDDTWSFLVRKSGRCNLASHEVAKAEAEKSARVRIFEEIEQVNAIWARLKDFCNADPTPPSPRT